MEVVKTTKEHTISKRRDGRFAVTVNNRSRKNINGDEKAKILADAGLIKLAVKAAAPVEEAPAEETTEAPAEETSAE